MKKISGGIKAVFSIQQTPKRLQSKNCISNFMNMLIIVFLSINFLVLFTTGGEAREVVVNSGLRDDVQAAVDAAKSGDTIRIPAGSFSYGAEEVILKSDITITGTGAQETILHRDVDAGWVGIFRIKGGNNITIKNIQFFGLNSPSASKDDFGIYISGDLKDFRITNCRFQYMSRGIAIEEADVTGVIDHCKFYDIYRPAIANLGYGIAPVGRTWKQNIQWGGPDALFIEDCEFGNMRHAVSAGSGMHYVFRHNHTTKNTPTGTDGDRYYHGWTAVDSHGGGYSDDFGTRAAEIYDNLLETEIQGEESGGAINIRGGDAVIFNNTIKLNYNDGISLTIEGGTNPTSIYQIHDTWIWNNTIQVPGRTIVNSYPQYIVLGEDYHLEQKPGYTPYTYPHPLALEDPSAQKEDLNQDGKVDVLDVQLCVNVFLGTEQDPGIIQRADVNGDGRVNVLDVQQIVNIILGR